MRWLIKSRNRVVFRDVSNPFESTLFCLFLVTSPHFLSAWRHRGVFAACFSPSRQANNTYILRVKAHDITERRRFFCYSLTPIMGTDRGQKKHNASVYVPRACFGEMVSVSVLSDNRVWRKSSMDSGLMCYIIIIKKLQINRRRTIAW